MDSANEWRKGLPTARRYNPGPRGLTGWDRPAPPIWDSAPRLGLPTGPIGAHWVYDPEPEPDPQPVRGWRLDRLAGAQTHYGHPGSHVLRDSPSPLPEYVLVRAPGSHDLFQVEHTGTGRRLTGPKPLASAKLALATMRSVMGSMGRVTA